MVTVEAAQEAAKQWGQDIRMSKSYAGFPLGLKASQDPRSVPEGAATLLQNLYFERRGMLRYIGGNKTVYAAGPVFAEFMRYYRAPQGSDDEIRTLLACKFDGLSSSEIWSIDEAAHTAVAVYTGMSLLYPSDACMIEIDGAAFVTQRDKRMLASYDAVNFDLVGFVQPVGVGFTASDAGYTGNLDSSGTGVPYSWVYVLRDKEGNSSNPTTTSATFSLTKRAAVFNMLDDDPPYVVSGEVTTIEIYRIGGTSSIWRLALSFTPNVSGGVIVDAATGLPPVDNTADINLPDIILSFNRNPPPRGLLKIVYHGSRIFGTGQSYDPDVSAELVSPSRLWVSRLNEPTAYGQDNNGVDDDGGVIDIDGNDVDWIFDMVSTGSVLIIGRTQSVYALQGTGFQTYTPTKLSNIGVASRRSMTREGNLAYYLGADGVLYLVDDNTPAPLTDPIQQVMDGISESNLASAVIWSHNRRIFVSIPLDSGDLACYFIDLHYRVPGDSTGPFSWTLAYGWAQLTDTNFRVSQGRSVNPYGVGDPAFVPQGGGRPQCFVAPLSGGIYEVLAPETATGTPIGVESPYLYFGNPEGAKGQPDMDIEGCLVDFMITGNLTYSSAPTVTFTFLQLDGTELNSTQDLRLAAGKMLFISDFPTSMTGIAFKWKLTGTITDGYISSAFYHWTPLRSEW